MYIANRRNSSKFKGYSPLKVCPNLINLKPAFAYLPYSHVKATLKKPDLLKRSETNRTKK